MPNTRIRNPALVAFAQRLARSANICQRGMRQHVPAATLRRCGKAASRNAKPTFRHGEKALDSSRLDGERAMLQLHGAHASDALVRAPETT
jgi:hypothetical protein